MLGTLYSAEFMKISVATFENGYVRKYNRNTIIGRYDTEGCYKTVYENEVKISNNMIGHFEYSRGYFGSNKLMDIYVRDNNILDSNKRIICSFDGDPSEAVAACMVCINKGLLATTSEVNQNSEINNNCHDKAPVSVGIPIPTGNSSSTGIGFPLICIAIVLFLIYALITMIPWAWSSIFTDIYSILSFSFPTIGGILGVRKYVINKSTSIMESIYYVFGSGLIGAIVSSIVMLFSIYLFKVDYSDSVIMDTITAIFIPYFAVALYAVPIIIVLAIICWIIKLTRNND